MRHKRHSFHHWVRKISWSRKCHPTPVWLPGKFQGQRSQRVRRDWATEQLNNRRMRGLGSGRDLDTNVSSSLVHCVCCSPLFSPVCPVTCPSSLPNFQRGLLEDIRALQHVTSNAQVSCSHLTWLLRSIWLSCLVKASSWLLCQSYHHTLPQWLFLQQRHQTSGSEWRVQVSPQLSPLLHPGSLPRGSHPIPRC